MEAPSPAEFGARPPTTTWMLSGVLVAVGSIIVGIGFVLLAFELNSPANYLRYLEGFYCCLGVGIMVVGSSWILARAGPRVR